MEQIKFNNELFPFREVEFDFGKRLISTENLNEKILDNNGNYSSEEARYIDESIFFFVDNISINLEEKTLISKIISEL